MEQIFNIASWKANGCTHDTSKNALEMILQSGRGGTWSMNIRGGLTGKSKKLPCPGVKFLKMIPCPGVKFS